MSAHAARWQQSWRADPRSAALADRHYNRQKIGAKQYVPPGACLCLRVGDLAVWVTSNPKAEYVQHAWAGAWVNSLFRNEGAGLSSELITEAVAITRSVWTPPPLGIVSFVDPRKVRSTNPGYCYQKAGWHHVGYTKGGLWAYQQLPDEMPEPAEPADSCLAGAVA